MDFRTLSHKLSKRLLVISLLLVFVIINLRADIATVQVFFKNDTLMLENNKIAVKYLWNDGNIILLSIKEKETDQVIIFPTAKQSLHLNGEFAKVCNSNLEIMQNTTEKYKKAIITFDIDGINAKQVLKVYEDASTVSNNFFFKGKSKNHTWNLHMNQNLEMIETRLSADDEISRIGHLGFDARHWKFRSIKFREATDHQDNPVEETSFLSYRTKKDISANLLFASHPQYNHTLFILKESPIGESQQYYPGFDFQVDYNGVSIHGLGVSPQDLHNEWMRGYGYTLGISKKGIINEKTAVLAYQKIANPFDFKRDFMIMSNTWGDRSKDSRMNENFVLQEIDAAARMGVTHFQLDDGWQQGLSRNSASKAGMKWDDWSKDDWLPHKERFPNGLGNIVKSALQKGIKIGLWFNPSKVDSYAQWERDADILLIYYRQYGISTFKIDGLDLMDKQAEINLRKLFSKVKFETNGKAVFNLDVTAGHRMGYHYFEEFGNIFLENRYTDWGNYYPYRSLRNLWLLSSYIPAQRFQIEFLNVDRNQDKYPTNDFAASYKVGQEYAFATTMMAQPLAWMEVSNFKGMTPDFTNLIDSYKEIAAELHSATTIPIGKEPDGTSWTGFLSLGEKNQHYLLIFRENAENYNFKMNLPFSIEKVERILGDSIDIKQYDAEKLELEMNDIWSFALLRITSK